MKSQSTVKQRAELATEKHKSFQPRFVCNDYMTQILHIWLMLRNLKSERNEVYGWLVKIF